MRKLIFTLGVLLILIAIGGPFATGKMAEKLLIDHESSIQATLPPWLELVEQEFDRSWFGSTSKARLVVTDPTIAERFKSVLGADQFGDQPAVMMESRITHGPLVGFLKPAIADIDTFFIAEGGKPLPAWVNTEVGFGDAVTMNWTVDDGAFTTPIGNLNWRGTTIRHVLNRSGDMSLTLEADAFEVLRDIDPVTADNLTIAWSTDQNNGRVDSLIGLDGIVRSGDQPPLAIELSTGVENLAPDAVQPLAQVLRALSVDDGTPIPFRLARAETDVRALFADEFTYTMNYHMELPEQPGAILDFDLRGDLAAVTDIRRPVDITRVLERAGRAGESTANMIINQAMVDALNEINPETEQQLLQAQAFGALVPDPDGDGYRLSMEYADSLITLNGMPMPLPPEPN